MLLTGCWWFAVAYGWHPKAAGRVQTTTIKLMECHPLRFCHWSWLVPWVYDEEETSKNLSETCVKSHVKILVLPLFLRLRNHFWLGFHAVLLRFLRGFFFHQSLNYCCLVGFSCKDCKIFYAASVGLSRKDCKITSPCYLVGLSYKDCSLAIAASSVYHVKIANNSLLPLSVYLVKIANLQALVALSVYLIKIAH